MLQPVRRVCDRRVVVAVRGVREHERCVGHRGRGVPRLRDPGPPGHVAVQRLHVWRHLGPVLRPGERRARAGRGRPEHEPELRPLLGRR